WVDLGVHRDLIGAVHDRELPLRGGRSDATPQRVAAPRGLCGERAGADSSYEAALGGQPCIGGPRGSPGIAAQPAHSPIVYRWGLTVYRKTRIILPIIYRWE